MNLLKCVSFFYDIGRSDWNSYERSTLRYVKDFISLYSTVEVDLTLFCDEKIQNLIEEEMKKVDNFSSHIKFEKFNFSQLYCFSEEFLSTISDIQRSDKMRSFSLRDTSGPPEYKNPLYVSAMFAKSEILKIAKQRDGSNDDRPYAWIDFGAAHTSTNKNFLQNLNKSKLISRNDSKIVLYKRLQIDVNINPWYYASLQDNVITPGGFYIVPSNLIDTFAEKFKKIVLEDFISNGIVDDDQTILAIFYAKNSDICELRDSSKFKDNPSEGDWFPIFEYIHR